MKISKIAALSILLLAILTLGAVSASDDLDNLTSSDISISQLDDADGEVGLSDDGVLEKQNVTTMENEINGDFKVNQEICIETEWIPGNAEGYVTYTFITDFENTSETRNLVEDFYCEEFWDEVNDEPFGFYSNNEYYKIKYFGNLTIRVDYSGDDTYNGASQSFSYFINNTDYDIYLEDDYLIEYKSCEDIRICTPDDFYGTLTVKINGKSYKVKYSSVMGGHYLNASLFSNNYGENTYTISYEGDEVFGKFDSGSRTINVESRFESPWDCDYGEFYVALELPSDATGKITVSEDLGWDDETNVHHYILYASQRVTGGLNNISIPDLPVGETSLDFKYEGNYPTIFDYTYAQVYPKINVAETAFAGDVIDVTVECDSEKNATLKLMEYDSATGKYVQIYSDELWFCEKVFIEPSRSVINGKGRFTLPDLAAGKYKVLIEVTGEEYKQSFSRELLVLNSTKLDLVVTTYNKVFIAGKSAGIYVYSPDYAKGTISAYVDGKLLERRPIDGYVYFGVDTTILDWGNHSYEVRFESDVFDNASYFGDFEIAGMEIIIPENVYLNGDNEKLKSVICYMAESMTGTLKLYLDGLEFKKYNVNSDSYFFPLTGIPVKDYDVEVVYSGDENHPQYSKSGKTRLCYNIEINDQNISYGENGNVITIEKPSNLNGGNLTVSIDGKVYYNRTIDSDEPIEIGVDDLDYGLHDVTACYTGDVLYPSLEVNKTIEFKSSILIPSQWSADGEISLTLPGDAKGNLHVDISRYELDSPGIYKLVPYYSINIPVTDGKASFSLDDLEWGEYYIKCNYSGNYNVDPVENTFSMKPKIDFTGSEIIEGYSTVSIESPVGGELIIRNIKSGEVLTIPLVNNKANYTFKNEYLGEVEINAMYMVNGTNVCSEIHTFDIIPNYSMREEFSYDPIDNITVMMPKDTNGYVNVDITYYSIFDDSIEDLGIFNATFEDGIAIVKLPKLPKGTYNYYIDVITTNYGYSYSERYNTVGLYADDSDLKDADLKINISDITVGENAVINVEINEDATGYVLIIVGDINETATISKGKASASISDLSIGDYTVIAKYYGSNQVSDDIAFAKLTVIDVENPANGTDTQGENITDSNTTVDKADPSLTASASDITVGEIVKITISINKDATGTLSIDDETIDIENGTATYNIPNLPEGTYTVNIKYSGDEQFKSDEKAITFNVKKAETPANTTETNSTDVPSGNTTDTNSTSEDSNTNTTVNKADPGLTASASDITVGEIVKIAISINKDATGTLSVDDETVNIVNGTATYNIPNLEEGTYTVNIKYSGDEQFKSDEKTVTFNVKKAETPEDTTESNSTDVPSENTTGQNGTDVPSENTTDSNSTSENTTDTNTTGENETQNNTGANATVEPEISIPSLDKPSQDGSVAVTLPSDATGTVTLTINNRDYHFDVVNGVSKVIIPDLGNGNYPYTITYSGDEKYSSFTSSSSLNVNKTPANTPAKVTDNTRITASPAAVTYAAGSYYIITVYGADGKPANGATVKITGKISKTLPTNANGVAKFKVTQKPGTYKITIAALGKSITKTITVKHLVTLKTVKVKKSAKKLVLQATLGKVNGKFLKNKKITFKFNGKKYTAKTNKKGIAKVTIKGSVLKKLKAGKKVTYQATYLKDTVKKTVRVKK